MVSNHDRIVECWIEQLQHRGGTGNTVKREKGINVWLTYRSPAVIIQKMPIVSPLVTTVGGLMMRAAWQKPKERGARGDCVKLSVFFIN